VRPADRTDNTRFHYPEVRLGATAGGIASLGRANAPPPDDGDHATWRKIHTGRAFDTGFVNRIVASDTKKLKPWWQPTDPLLISASTRLVNEVTPMRPIERMVGISQIVATVRQSDDLQEVFVPTRKNASRASPAGIRTHRVTCAIQPPVFVTTMTALAAR
jgi:enoyl-CoA hydratase/carnithine racemase